MLGRNLRAIWTVFRFESVRSLTPARLAVWMLLTAFPPSLIALNQSQEAELQRDGRAAVALFILIPELVNLMSLLLAAAPVLYAELEGKTWTYLAISPAGKGAILLGKYFAAVSFTILAAWTSLAICLWIVWPEQDGWRVAWVLAALVPLACLVYGAVFVFLGVVFLRRAMVAAVTYTFISEILIGFIPALINQLTVQYHLRNLLAKWIGWDTVAVSLRMNQQFFSASPPWEHVAVLLGATAVFLAFSIAVLRRRELALSDRT